MRLHASICPCRCRSSKIWLYVPSSLGLAEKDFMEYRTKGSWKSLMRWLTALIAKGRQSICFTSLFALWISSGEGFLICNSFRSNFLASSTFNTGTRTAYGRSSRCLDARLLCLDTKIRLYTNQPTGSGEVFLKWPHLLLRLSGTNLTSSVMSASVSTVSPSNTRSHSCLASNHALTRSMKELPLSLSFVLMPGDSRATTF